MVALTLVQIGLQVRLNLCNRDFFDALDKDALAAVISGLVALNVVSLLWLRYRADINNRELLIALALDVAVKDGRIKPGDLVMIEAIGGGFTWGSALVRW